MEPDTTTRPDVPELVPKELWPDPHPHYHRMRAETPILAVPEWDEFVFTRWDDCERILRDPAMSSDHVAHRRMEVPMMDFGDLARPRTMLMMDPPDHTRLRQLVSKAFTPRTVERLRPHVADLVAEMLDEVDPSGFDLISGLAYPLPVTVICELLGVPAEDRHLFGPWSSDASRMLDADLDEETIQRGLIAFMSLVNYLNGIFEERRAHPRDDLLSALLAAEEAGDRLSDEELRATVVLLFVAGHETTMNLIGNGTVAMLRQRDQWDRLAGDPTHAPGAVEESLRFDGPVHITARTATVDTEVGGQRIEAGQGCVTLLAAANRDPARFADPDRFDLTRQDNHHLTFSHGIHYCLGAALARLEGQEVFKALSQRFPRLELTEEPVHREHFVLRGYQAVPVRAA
jgi:cytochrome P450